MAGKQSIEDYRKNIHHAETVFNEEVRKNGCPSADVKQYYCHTFLGRGKMGQVHKVEKGGSIFAMKQQSKAYYREKRMQFMPIREKQYWWAMCNPFIVDLLFKAKDKDNLYLIMEYTPHGDLQKMVVRGTMPEDKCRKLLCQVVMALEYLHACNLVHRDMKPNNILVFPRGRLKVADFGLCIRQSMSTNSFGGSCPYLSPEMINKALYNHTTDWWSVGIMMFLLLLRRHPFGAFDEPREDLCRHILGRRIQGLDDADLTEEAKDLLRKLLIKDFTVRITSGTEGVDEVKKHPWFKSIDFDQLITQQDFVELDAEDDHSEREAMVSDDIYHYIGEDEEDPLRADYNDF